MDDFHLQSNEGVLTWLNVTDQGLSASEAAARLLKHGRNELTPHAEKSKCRLFLDELMGFFAMLLEIATILCFVAYGIDQSQLDNLYLGVALAFVVLISCWFSFYQNAKSLAILAGFKSFLPSMSLAVRDGAEKQIPSEELVPGDFVKIKEGNKIPADIRILTSTGFKVDNSALTGESDPQQRSHENDEKNQLEATNLVFFGTLCVSGVASGVVINTGDNTCIGKIAHLAAATGHVKPPLVLEIESFIKMVTIVALGLGTTFLILALFFDYTPVQAIVFAIGIVVGNVPEGLLVSVTVTLTITAQRMARRKVLVKNLASIETLGSTTVIASDKTGTLTQNRMTVSHVCINRGLINVLHDKIVQFDSREPTQCRLLDIIALCNNATFQPQQDHLPLATRAVNGDASETALLKFAEHFTKVMPLREQWAKLPGADLPFNSNNKFQSSVHANGPARLVVMKGAAERVLERCDAVLVHGQAVPLVADEVRAMEKHLEVMMGQGERVLGVCYAELPPEAPQQTTVYTSDPCNWPHNRGQGLVLVGFVSMIDPPRPTVPHAVALCVEAGIKVIMVTGDHAETAEAIARKVNIIRGKTRRDVAREDGVSVESVSPDDARIDAIVVTGSQLANLNDEEFQAVLDHDQIVFARTSPQQKLKIVHGLQHKREILRGHKTPKAVRHIVAVTGDGVNDSPALKAADIGIAMGLTGSDVARDSAKMILLDDNFASIVNGVEEGRVIFDNLKKSIAFTLSTNIGKVVPFLAAIIAGLPLALSTILIMAIDIGTDLFPGITFAYEAKEADVMSRRPRDSATERLVNVKLISYAYFQIGILLCLCSFYAYLVVLNDYGLSPWDLPGMYIAMKDGVTLAGGAVAADSGYTNPLVDDCLYYQGTCRAWFHACNIPGGVCHNPQEMLRHAQSAYFVAMVVARWADLYICKTRMLSLKHHGVRNTMLNWGVVYMLLVCVVLLYIPPVATVLQTAPLRIEHWFCPLPFVMMLFLYDEVRKWWMRNMSGNNWLFRNTYY